MSIKYQSTSQTFSESLGESSFMYLYSHRACRICLPSKQTSKVRKRERRSRKPRNQDRKKTLEIPRLRVKGGSETKLRADHKNDSPDGK